MTASAPARRAAVVYESMFGNTAAIATAVAKGLEQVGVQVVATDVADPALTTELTYDLVVLGAPTHAFSLSRPKTRADAVAQGADGHRGESGLREWLAAVSSGAGRPLVAAFDTRMSKVRRLPFGAARAAARLARRRGFRIVGKPTGFVVTGTKGPLADGELERAATWGRELAGYISQPGETVEPRP